MTSLKENQEEILAEFRKQVESEGIIHEGDSIGTDDVTLLRFLRARNFDVPKSKTMLANCQSWRTSVEGIGIDAIYEEIDPFDYPEREIVFKYWPLWYHKTDKQGRPINIQAFGAMDIVALNKHVDPKRQWRAFLANCEALTREILPGASRAKGSTVAGSYCIVDLKGFGLGQFWSIKSIVRDSFQISQDYFPEVMGRLAVVNAPSTFTIIWSIIKPWLAPATVEKVDILGYDYAAKLLQDIDAENLPESLGGKCTCEGLGGCSLSSAGPWLDGRVYTGHGESKFRGKTSGKVNGGESMTQDGNCSTKVEDESDSQHISNEIKAEEL